MDVIPNGIELSQFDRVCPATVRADLEIPDDVIVVGMTARLNREKGAQVFAAALPHIARRFKTSGLSSRATAHSRRPFDKRPAMRVPKTACVCSVFAATSPDSHASTTLRLCPRSSVRTFGWVLLEAMAAGKPLVATHVGAIPEVLQHERQGLLVPPDDSASLSDAIARLVVDEALRQTLGRAGRATVEQQYTESVMIQRTLALYDRILSDTPIVAADQPGNEERTVLC